MELAQLWSSGLAHCGRPAPLVPGYACATVDIVRKGMVISGRQVRFSRSERDSARCLGIDLTSVRTLDQYSDAIARLIRILEADRPDLLEKIARALAEKTGRRMPTNLRRVR
jgi:hypothetical protein